MKDKLKNYGFWLSLVSAVLILLQTVGLRINIPVVNEITNAVLGLFVVLGIISNPSQGKGFKDENFNGINDYDEVFGDEGDAFYEKCSNLAEKESLDKNDTEEIFPEIENQDKEFDNRDTEKENQEKAITSQDNENLDQENLEEEKFEDSAKN